MKISKKVLALSLAAAMTIPIAVGCGDRDRNGGGNGNNNAADWYIDYKTVSNQNADYNQDLYYLNEFKFLVADPSVIYVDHGEEKGYFYAYGTSDMVGGYGIQCWRSSDLTNWEYKSVAYHPDFDNAWGFRNHWAPEVIYDPDLDKYLMFYNADWVDGDTYTDEWTKKGENAKSMDVVVSDNPYGPFVPLIAPKPGEKIKPVYDVSPRNSLIAPDAQRSNAIDAHPYIDPNNGEKYLYYSGYGYNGHNKWQGQTIFVVKMKDGNWLEPDYSTVREITKLHNSTVDRNDDDCDEGKGIASVNEGAFVWYHDGKYYLTFSVYAFTQTQYQVRQAVADNPLGPFTKIKPEDGGQIIFTEATWDGKIQSAGHHCFITCGDELMIAYHSFYNRRNIDNARAIAIDTISWVKNEKGQNLMHANGPTYAYMPLPEEISGYKNLAPQATITANNTAPGSDVKYLQDKTLKVHGNDLVKEFETTGGTTEITLNFGDYVNVRSIMIYNSISYKNTFPGISSIVLSGRGSENKVVDLTIKNIPFDYAWHTDGRRTVYPGASSIAEFAEMPINKIKITVNAPASEKLYFNEIIVLGKEIATGTVPSSLKTYTYVPHEELPSRAVYESRTFGSVGDVHHSAYGFDLEHDDGTENAYVDKYWAGNSQELYFKDVESTVLYAEVEMSVLDHLNTYNNDPFPKAGLVLRCRNRYFISYNIDYTSTFDSNRVGFVQSNSTGSDYNWNNYTTFEIPNLKYTGTNYAKLGIARINDKVYLFANGQLVNTLSGVGILSDDPGTASAVAFVTFNCFTRYKNYSCITDRTEVVQKLAELGVTV